MRVPLTWLREYCDPGLDAKGIEERLTMTGTKVEAIHHHGVGNPERFVVGRVADTQPHPDADRLRVCRVDLGAGAGEGAATIVCGAPNVAAGQTVAVARPGAVLPDGNELREARLRGVLSEGMILAEDELALGSGHDGILILGDRAADSQLLPGTPLADVLPIATDVLELEITPNRPDCLGVYGVARELHAATGAPLSPPPWAEDPGGEGPIGSRGAPPEVTVECPDLCPRFTARVFENVTVAPSPAWLRGRLMAAGQRPISNVVDITNYVMLLTGQPLHAFDLDRVAGERLTVRRAREGEQVRTLDGETRRLDPEMVVIEDAEGPTSIAGLMGGARSEVQPDTTRVLLEVATWNGPNIHRSSVLLGLRSEASGRFEKGLAPEQCMHAQAVATRLMIECSGATVLNGTIDVGGVADSGAQPHGPMIRLRDSRVRGILGMSVPVERQAAILEALDFRAEPAEDGLDVRVPALRRGDVAREADLIEEVARINGLERLPATLPKRRGAYGLLSPGQRLRRRAVDVLTGRGLYEVVGWTFTSPSLADRLRLGPEDVRRDAAAVENPLSEEQSLLRTTLLGSLLDAARQNSSRGMGDLRLFEIGTVFHPGAPGRSGNGGARGRPSGTGIDEHRSLALLLAGRLHEAGWGAGDPPVADFFAAKGFLEALVRALRAGPLELAPAAEPFLRPGRSAAILLGGEGIGWLGELHPLVAESWELQGASCLEIDLDRLVESAIENDRRSEGYVDLIGYPPLRQDLAVILPAEVAAGEALATVRAAAGELLNDVRVFDVYTGPQVGDGRRSLALALSFRSSERTLTDADVAPVREGIVAALRRLGGELRV